MSKDDMIKLEEMIDGNSLAKVLEAISIICDEKREHLLVNWQDRNQAKTWAVDSRKVYNLSNKVIN